MLGYQPVHGLQILSINYFMIQIKHCIIYDYIVLVQPSNILSKNLINSIGVQFSSLVIYIDQICQKQ